MISVGNSANKANRAYQSFHSPMKCMSVIPTELGVSSVEGRITVGFGLLNSIQRFLDQSPIAYPPMPFVLPRSLVINREGREEVGLPVAMSLFVLVMLRRVLGF